MVLFFMGYFSSSGQVILIKYDMRFFNLLKEPTGVDKVHFKNRFPNDKLLSSFTAAQLAVHLPRLTLHLP